MAYLPHSVFATLYDAPMAHHKAGLSWTASGYGKRIPSAIMVAVDNGGPRRHRVYVTIYGNAGTAWFNHRGTRYILPDTAERGDRVLCVAS